MKNKQQHSKVLLNSFPTNGHTFHQKLENILLSYFTTLSVAPARESNKDPTATKCGIPNQVS